MKKLFMLIILGSLFFICGCDNNLENVYKKEIQLLNSLVAQENNESYVKEDIIDNLQKIYIDNEKLLVMGRAVLISEVNEILPIKNVVKIDSTYIVFFLMESENFIILCDKNGIIENMFFIKHNALSSDYYMHMNDENGKKEILQTYGYFYHLTPLILDEKQQELDSPFYELVFSDGMIYHFYVNDDSNDFIITSYKSVNSKIDKKIMDKIGELI